MYDHLSEIAARADHSNALRDAHHLLGAELPNRPPRGVRRYLAFARRTFASPQGRGQLDDARTQARNVRPASSTPPIAIKPAHR